MENKFWNFIENPDNVEEVELRIDGEITMDDGFWSILFGDNTVTPKGFMSELAKHKGKNITVWINSYGGDIYAASRIYTALKEHQGKVTVKIDGVALSAASVIAMAGDEVLMSPTSIMMIHNPWGEVVGEAKDLRHGADVLDEVKESIINAYQLKTGKSRAKISKMMDEETWMSAKKAVAEGFADGMLYTEAEKDPIPEAQNFMFSRMAVLNKASESTKQFLEQYIQKSRKFKNEISPDDFKGTPFADLPIVDEPWNPDEDTDAEIIDEILGPNGDDWEAMKKAHLAYAPGEERGGDPPKQRNAYKLKIARRRNGVLTVYWQQLVSRVAILNGAREGVDISKEAKQQAWEHAMKYYEKFGVPKEEWPEPKFDLANNEKVNNKKEDDKVEIKTVDELKQHFPELIAQIEAAAREEGIKAERQRIQAIDEISRALNPELVNRAKYERPMTAGQLALEALKVDAVRGRQYLEDLKKDYVESGSSEVKGQPFKPNKESDVAQAIAEYANKRRRIE